MKKRIVCFIMAAVLMLLAYPAFACSHRNEDGEPLEYVLKGYIAPQIGVPGYSGDFCCPRCGAVIIPGAQIAALEEPSGPGSGTNPSGPTADPPKTTPQKTNPAVTPEKPAKTKAPAATKKPTKAPKATKKPTAKPKKTAKPTQIPVAVTKTPAPKKDTRPKQTEKPTPTAAKDKKSGQADSQRIRFSTRFPYRRVRMKPQAGIRAEAAGILLLPAASPFQSILGQ